MFIILGKRSAAESHLHFLLAYVMRFACLEASSYFEQMLLSVPPVLVSLTAGLGILTCEAHITCTWHSPSPSTPSEQGAVLLYHVPGLLQTRAHGLSCGG